jgi:hypothetical protein
MKKKLWIMLNVIPPDLDEVTDEEDILENGLIKTTYDVAGT